MSSLSKLFLFLIVALSTSSSSSSSSLVRRMRRDAETGEPSTEAGDPSTEAEFEKFARKVIVTFAKWVGRKLWDKFCSGTVLTKQLSARSQEQGRRNTGGLVSQPR